MAPTISFELNKEVLGKVKRSKVIVALQVKFGTTWNIQPKKEEEKRPKRTNKDMTLNYTAKR